MSKSKGKSGKNIVDPSKWNSSEVSGVAEGDMHRKSSPNARGGTKVTSIRSSLFKKAAQSANAGSSKKRTAADNGLVFEREKEALAIDRSLTHIGNSALRFCEYGKQNRKVWAKDVFALVHNGIRSELGDLSVCLRACKTIRENLTFSEFRSIRQWWKDFTLIVVDYGSLEQEILAPWMEKAVSQSEEPDLRAQAFLKSMPGKRTIQKRALQAIEKHFASLLNEDESDTPQLPKASIAANLVLNMDRVVNLIADYLWEEEVLLSAIISGYYKDEKVERPKIIQEIIQFIVSSKTERKQEALVLQTRWMLDPKACKAHVKAIVAVHDCAYQKYSSQFEVVHAGIPAVFKVKGDVTEDVNRPE